MVFLYIKIIFAQLVPLRVESAFQVRNFTQ